MSLFKCVHDQIIKRDAKSSSFVSFDIEYVDKKEVTLEGENLEEVVILLKVLLEEKGLALNEEFSLNNNEYYFTDGDTIHKWTIIQK